MSAFPPAPAGLWLHGKRFDLGWFLLAVPVLYLGLTGLSDALGQRGPMLAWVASSAFTGIPHNAITWMLTMPRHSRGYYARGVMFWPLVVSAVALAPTVMFFGEAAFGWALTINIVIAYYHITRQHMGLIHSADGRYRQATGDATIAAEGADLRAAIGALAAAAMLWKGTGGPMLLGLGQVQYPFTLWPMPAWAAVLATVAAAAYLGRWAWRTAARSRRGEPFPVLHATIGGGAMLNLTAAAAIPNDRLFLTLALVASFHNVQYFAFCYHHHHLRAAADPGATDLLSRFARDRRWLGWWSVPWLAGVGFVALCAVLPPFWNAVLLNGAMISHYFVDGAVWRRKYYARMTEFARNQVGAPGALTAVVPEAPAPVGDRVGA